MDVPMDERLKKVLVVVIAILYNYCRVLEFRGLTNEKNQNIHVDGLFDYVFLFDYTSC